MTGFNRVLLAVGAGLLFFGCETSRASERVSENTMAFEGNFRPRRAPNGGFGGDESCRSGARTRVPVVFVHGNGDTAANWNKAASDGGRSVIEWFVDAGFTKCDLFGIDYLSRVERGRPSGNFHRPATAEQISEFIIDVLEYTGAERVDVVSHSLGVTMSLESIEKSGLWNRVRKFIAIAGAMRGLYSCLWAGPANPMSSTCGSQNVVRSDVFGFFPDGAGGARNERMGEGPRSFGRMPEGRETEFYTLRAGVHDEVVCGFTDQKEKCSASSMFEAGPNVVAQLHVGAGEEAPNSPVLKNLLETGGDQGSGVGHMRAKTDTGRIQVNMLTTSCRNSDCCRGYNGRCEN